MDEKLTTEKLTAEKLTAENLAVGPSGTKVKFPAAEVREHAEAIRAALLTGHPRQCPNVRCEIAGSLRRGAKEVSDIELVLEPTFETDLFGNSIPGASSILDAAISRCLENGLLAWDTKIPRNGSRYKRFVVPALGLPLDLFLTGEDNWGNIFAIRTGDKDFSTLLVTHRSKGGLMPDWKCQKHGRLYVRAKGYPNYVEDDADNEYIENALSCPTEAEFFRHLFLDVPPMALRTAQGVPELRRQAALTAAKLRSQALSPLMKAAAPQKAQVA